MNEESTFGSWVHRQRRALDLTQRELAQMVHCSISTIVKIESDQRRPSRQIAELLAEHLSIPDNHVELFLRAARGLKPVDQTSPFPSLHEPHLQTTTGKATCVLPVPPTALVGRGTELAEIKRLLMLPECRLLSIVGFGGVGKTRLALQVAHDLCKARADHFSDGFFFVSLAPIMAIENIPKAVAQAISFEFAGPLYPEAQLRNYLQNKTLLLLLDNAEHLLGGAETFSRILESAPGVNLLVTSRERLNLRNEWVFDLHGLPVPPIDIKHELEEYSAAKLFLDRAQQVQNDFSLQEKDRPIVADICRMLYGIPLGIELAAAWVRALPLGEIAIEIANDLDFLATSARDMPERHRSLRVVFDHSWNLLSFAEQRALRQLSVFQGGFTREAAQEITGSQLTLLNSLIDKSLLRRSEPSRYDLHDLVRVYAAACLSEAPEEEASVQQLHSRYFLSMVRDVGPDLHSSHQKVILTRLSFELANIRNAWTWAVAHNQVELLSETAQSLWYFFELRNYYREAEAVFRYAADMVRNSQESRSAGIMEVVREKYASALGRFLMYQAYFAMRLGQIDEAETYCQSSISLLRSIEDPEALAHALSYYAVLNWTLGKLDLAWALLKESLPLSKKHGSPWQITLITGILGNVAYERGEYEQSYLLLNNALERCQVIGDPRLTGFVSAYLGRTGLMLKRIDEVEGSLWESARITQESGDRFGYGLILKQLALVAQTKQDDISAEQLFAASVDLFRDIGDAWYLSRALNAWGDFKRSQGELTQAAELFRQGIKLSLDARAFLITLEALIGLGWVYAQQGDVKSALEFAIRVIEHPASPQDARNSAQGLQHDLESRFTADEVEAIKLRAQSNGFEEFARAQL